MIQLFIDENVPISVMEWLKNKGLRLQRVPETGLRGAKDETIARYAVENNMIIFTLDMDFAYIYYNIFRGSLGVIVIRVKPSTPINIIEAFNKALMKIRPEEFKGKLAIITKKRVRIIS